MEDVEKNTGDGFMAVFVGDDSPTAAVDDALDAATTCIYALSNWVNPHLRGKGLNPIDIRIGIDFGPLLLSRIGIPSGSAAHQRNFLTAVGATANIACRIQQAAATNQIWVGDAVKLSASFRHQSSFQVPVMPSDWNWWNYLTTGQKYWIWNYAAVRFSPGIEALAAALLRAGS